MPDSTFHQRLALEPSPALHEQIRSAWARHSRALESRDLDAVLATVSPDCAYEIVPIGQRWEGHAGARAFYGEMFEATSKGWWGGMPPTGRVIELKLIVYFPWDAVAERFAGERVWFA
ncbi:MAG: hypothetical protein EB084_00705 [Proteobacteria bacterium]|nr:hypothetical protein [Pseudomonadota bacterium]